MVQIFITNDKGTFDVTGLATTVRWSGDYKQAARSLDISLVSSPADETIPVADCPVGSAVLMRENKEDLFDGFVVTRGKSTDSNTLTLNCYDRGWYLKRNRVLKKYSGITPEDITAKLATEFGFEAGNLAATGVAVSRNFLTGNSTLYDIVATAYTLASQSTGKKYHIGFRGKKLYVAVKEPNERTLIIQGRSNLIAASTTESSKDVVTTVQVYDKNDNLARTLEDAERRKLYGRLQEVVKQTDKDDKAAEAQRKLDDGDVEQKITVDCLGNTANVSGGCVVVKEPYTGLYGLFWIDSDTHEWKRGQYYNQLVLNYNRLMDEKEAGTLPNADGKKTSGSGLT